ncbi:MAG TPA: hypothetical protein VHE09_04240 [Rhizomicrobium sp.]|jgi:hypothetical protein|nr:hypothetical protein [Rhizomicrobium sp.]
MNNYLAVFVGSKDNPRMAAWMKMSDAERKAKEQEGIAAWHAWMQKHANVVVGEGGPLGKTKRVSPSGIADVSNNLGGFVVVNADSHEAAAKLFESHPHFTIFPGEGVEVMPVMPIPGR